MLSQWRAEKNEKARTRLARCLPAQFPAGVLAHAFSRPLIPTTPRRCIESYWRHHPVRADRLARALAAKSEVPAGWTWRLAIDNAEAKASGLPLSFRVPPAPFREAAHDKGPGHCCVCGQPVYRHGWHTDPTGEGKVNKKANWHACCVAAWKLWNAPSDHVRALKAAQQRRCTLSGKRLLKDAEVDHRVPLYRVWRDHQQLSWAALLAHWGVPNLQVTNRAAHRQKSIEETMERAALLAERRNAA
jgi:hypothetical protein